jgi:hypothetical protein
VTLTLIFFPVLSVTLASILFPVFFSSLAFEPDFLIITFLLPFSLDSGKHAFLYSFLLLESLLNDRLRPFHLEYKVESH